MGFASKFGDVAPTSHYIPNTGRWTPVEWRPTGPLQIHPCCPAINYAASIFEGMKCRYDTERGHFNIFRLDEHFERINKSCRFVGLPALDRDTFEFAVKSAVSHAEPTEGSGYLYLRPVVYCSDETHLGATPPQSACFYVLSAVVQKGYFNGAMKLLALTDRVRAWIGGTGHVKFSGNYGSTNGAVRDAIARGYSQILWLFPETHDMTRSDQDWLITEAGVSNFFALVEEAQGPTVYTPPLTKGLVLPGITRLSVLQFARDMGYHAEEREIFMEKDLIHWRDQGQLLACFATGTATGIAPVDLINYKDTDIALPSTHPIVEELGNKLLKVQLAQDPAYASWLTPVAPGSVPDPSASTEATEGVIPCIEAMAAS